VAAFNCGLLTLWIALETPLSWLAGVLFEAHMLQHELLMLVAPLLLVLGRPVVVSLWILPSAWRSCLAVGRWIGIRRVVRIFENALVASVLFAAALWIWHLPVLYDAALVHPALHAIEHLSFLGTAMMFWGAVLRVRQGRRALGAATFFTFVTGLHSNLLGALIALASRPWYRQYQQAASAWDVTPLADQQRAGLLMWVPSSLAFTLTGLALTAMWLTEAGRRAAANDQSTPGRGATASGAPFDSTLRIRTETSHADSALPGR
jgi:cytochrome c oxidase assembly factor CtaG